MYLSRRSILLAIFISTGLLSSPLLNQCDAQIVLTSGLADLGDYTYVPMSFETVPDNAVISVNTALTSDAFASSRGSSHASYSLDGGSVLTLSADSIPTPDGPERIGHVAELTLDLEFSTAGTLTVFSPPPTVYLEFDYGTTSVSGGADLMGAWYGDWPPDPSYDPPSQFVPRSPYTDLISVDAGPLTVSILARGSVSRSGNGMRSSGYVQFTFVPEPLLGDWNGDQLLDAIDVDLLAAEIRAGTHRLDYDLNRDSLVNRADVMVWISQLKQTWLGDADLDGLFDSSDLVTVFRAGEYEDRIKGNSGWADGDWDGNGDFESADFVVALSDGGYEKGPRRAVATVPEPTGLGLVGLVCILASRRAAMGFDFQM